MNYYRNFIIACSILIFTFSANFATAKGSEIEFNSLVSAVVQTDGDEGTITVSIHGVDVGVIVNGDTEIEESGEEVGIAVISVGDFVSINAFFLIPVLLQMKSRYWTNAQSSFDYVASLPLQIPWKTLR